MMSAPKGLDFAHEESHYEKLIASFIGSMAAEVWYEVHFPSSTGPLESGKTRAKPRSDEKEDTGF